MILEDFIYLFLLLFSTVCGFFLRNIEDSAKRKYACTLLGFAILLPVSGYHIFHLLLLTIVNAGIVLKINKRYCHVVSFVFCFSYILFTRTSEYFGLPSPPEITNTALMIMVLKMVGLAYEVNLHHLKSISSDKADSIKEIYTRIKPNFLDIIQYSFCYAGILVGPYYKYRTYDDLFEKPYSTCVPHQMFLKKRLIVIPFYICLYLLSDYFFPLSLAASEEIWEFSFLSRIFYMWPWFFSFRMRIYVAFVLGECICMNLGLGAYPEKTSPAPGAGPTDFHELQNIDKNVSDYKYVAYNFETIRCMNEFASEFRPTMREGIRYWNMTVQYWLAIYIYRKTAASKPVKMVVTMFVSAIWHGVRAGYYLSLLGTPLLLIAEIEVEKAFRKNLSGNKLKIYDTIWYFVKMQCISYMGVAFVILDFKVILNYWNSIYYFGHFFTLFMFSVAFLKNTFV
ncbi:lysophospholipid acyltransferase 7-like, partial [Uloborus diversus]|uniref:lysophospholipid acyltransferase 7-like n=1 Tax=Uloborus diversus TaxID=327109 RepID=UPI002409F9CF